MLEQTLRTEPGAASESPPSHDVPRSARVNGTPGADGSGVDDRASGQGGDEMRDLAARLKRAARLLKTRDPSSARAFERGGIRFERLAAALDAPGSDARVRDARQLVQQLNAVVGERCFFGIVAMRWLDGQRPDVPEPRGVRGSIDASRARDDDAPFVSAPSELAGCS